MRSRDFFKVETLDTRLGSTTGGEPLREAQPSKWNTVEYYVYYVVFLTIPPLMFKQVYDVSQPEHPNYTRFAGLLRPGWIPGRLFDNSDAQYRGFRSNIPYMALLLVIHPLLRRAYESIRGKGEAQQISPRTRGDASTALQAANERLRVRVNFDLVFAAIYLIALHGISSLKVFIILWLNYQIGTKLPNRAVPVATWTFNICVLFANELTQGFRFAPIGSLLLPSQAVQQGDPALYNWGAWLDTYGGLIPRWEVLFNITVLRLIAFNFDHLWMQNRRASSPIEKKNLDPTALPERDRVNLGAKPEDFTFRNYIAYILYSPLYLTGPIFNFNDYISQTRYQLPSISRSRIIPYALRFVLCLLTMEVVLHFLYAVAISKAEPDWNSYTPFQLTMLGYFNLHIIWLKLLLPWRFFRLWALLDGIDPPENMIRCMSDNYSALSFWRGWHRSYNQWILRYIYVPLGGNKVSRPRAVANYLLVFTFVALWHDINLRLLMWGWMVVLFVVPEVLASFLFPERNWRDHPNVYRWLCAVGAVANIWMMMAANLVGFALGVDGLRGLVHGIVGTVDGRSYLIIACATLFVGAQVMFEVRETEKRRGIHLRL